MIASIKLTSGEDLVGEILSENDHWIELKRPMTITILSKGKAGYYQLSPYTYIDEKIAFSKAFIVHRSAVFEELGEIYLRMIDVNRTDEVIGVDPEDEQFEDLKDLVDTKHKSTLH